MAARWEPGKSGKLPSELKNKRESKRTSFYISKPRHAKTDICDNTEKFYDEDTGTGRPRGQPTLYTPEQVYNMRSQYARYERGLELIPAKVEAQGRNTVYWYPSCDAPDGFWKVTVSSGATFLELDDELLNIVCPKPYEVKGKSDATSFQWIQLSGNRTVLFSNPNSLDTTIDLLNTCIPGTGCDSGTSLPIVIRVFVPDQTELYDDLIIYSTPTSNNWGNSFSFNQVVDPRRQVSAFTPAPEFVQKAYVNTGGAIAYTWSLPELDSENMVFQFLEINTTGEYIPIEEFLSGEDRLALFNLNTRYRVTTYYDVNGRKTAVAGKPFGIYPTDNQKIILGDDTQRGISFKGGKSFVTVTSFIVQNLTYTDRSRGNSFKSGKQLTMVTPLGARTVEGLDRSRGVSYKSGKQSYTKTNLGGIVIG